MYFTATLDAAVWGAELAVGVGAGRIYVVEPTGSFEDDPNLTDKKFPGNPTKSYRSRQPLRVTGEIIEWQGHAPEVLQAMKDNVERLRQGASKQSTTDLDLIGSWFQGPETTQRHRQPHPFST